MLMGSPSSKCLLVNTESVKISANNPNLTVSYIAEKLPCPRVADTLAVITITAYMASGGIVSAWLIVGYMSPQVGHGQVHHEHGVAEPLYTPREGMWRHFYYHEQTFYN